MLKYLSRLLLVGWFVGMVIVAVRDAPAQGQTPISHNKYLPLMTRRAFSLPPANWGDYVGLFIGDQDGRRTIFTMRGDGRELTSLTTDARPKRKPTFSPDGRYITYIHTADEWYEALMVMNADGSNPVQLAASDESISYQWSPTGNQLLVQVRQGYPYNLLLVDADTATTRPIITLPQEYPSPMLWGWSPDGRHIHFTQPGANPHILELWTEELASGTRTRVSERFDPQIGTQVPQWSPDSRELLFIQDGLWMATTPDGSAVRSLFESQDYWLNGWVMDNTHYLLSGRSTETDGLALMPVMGGPIEHIILANPSLTIGGVVIEPNGDSIFYQSHFIEPPPFEGPFYWHSFAAGATPVLIIDGCYDCHITSQTWAPDGQTILFSLREGVFFMAQLRPVPHPATQIPFYGDGIWSVAYLPGSSRLAMIRKTSSGYPYYDPPPFLDKPQLIDDESGTLSPFPFPFEGMFEFGEWRHEP